MFYTLIKKPQVVPIVSISPSYERLTPKSVEKNGVLSRTSIFERFDSSLNLKMFDFDDFQIQNILSIGALDMLKPTYMSDSNNLDAIDQVVSVLKSNLPKSDKNV